MSLGGVGGAVLAAAAVLGYCALGGVMFFLLEGSSPASSSPPRPDPAAPLRARAVQRLWAITEDLNILYKDNWTALASRELEDFQRRLSARPDDTRWTLAGSCLYALTLITTIGHGNVAPKSSAGKLAAIAYACVGIPLVLLYLSAAGNLLARAVRTLCRRLTKTPIRSPRPRALARTPFEAALAGVAVRSRGARADAGGGRTVPALCGALLAAGYVLGGAVLFRHTERWSLLDGCVFAFSSLATVGLHPPPRAALAAAAYIVFGVAVVAAGAELLRAPAGPPIVPPCTCS